MAGVLLLAVAAVPAGSDSTMRVLFIGNSYTFFNDVPALVETLARAAGTRIKTRAITVAGSTLRGHWSRGHAVAAIRQGGWDWVILQEQSSLGVPRVVGGIPRITDARQFHASVRKFDREIRAVGARTMLLLTWSAQPAPEEQQRLDHAYLTIARTLQADVAPAGMAWSIVREEHPWVNLYAADGAHPAPAGSYLAACSVFAALTGRSPERLPYGIAGRDAPLLQRAAWRAHRQLTDGS